MLQAEKQVIVMQLTRPKAIAIMLLVVLVALGSASGVFAPVIEPASIQLTPAFGCPGQQITVVITLSQGELLAPGSVTVSNGIELLKSYPDGLITNLQLIGGFGRISGTFTVGDSVCAGDYVVTLNPLGGIDGVGQPIAFESVSTHFTVGGNGCPNLPVCRPVGGVVMPTNRLAITAPYLALAGLVAVVSTVVLVKRRRD